MAKPARTDQVRIVFLGGLGEIGRNVLPDFTCPREQADRVEGV